MHNSRNTVTSKRYSICDRVQRQRSNSRLSRWRKLNTDGYRSEIHILHLQLRMTEHHHDGVEKNLQALIAWVAEKKTQKPPSTKILSVYREKYKNSQQKYQTEEEVASTCEG